MNALIPVQDKAGIEVVDSRLIADSLEIEHRALLQTVSKYQKSIESNFGRVAFEMLPLKTPGGVQETRVALLTEDQAIFIATLSRNTDKVVHFKALIVQSFQESRRKRQSTALSQLDILAQSVQILQQQARELAEVKADQAELKETVRLLDARTQTIPDYFTVAGYANLNRISIGLKAASSVGQRASRICKERGIIPETTPDPRFGTVNMYPSQVLKEVFSMPIV